MTHEPLSAAQLAHYADHGYVVVKDLFSSDEVEVFRKRFLAVVTGEVAPAPGMLVMRDVMVAKGAVSPETKAEAIAKIQDLHEDPVFWDGYMRHEGLLDIVESITGADIKSIHSMLINKPPNVDGRHPLHQDLLYFPFRPADRIVGTWTALETCTRENGCLVVVPGTHKGDILPHGDMDWEYQNAAYFGVKGEGVVSERVHLEMQPGETVFFHPVLIHGSGRNRTAGFRRAISAHYASADCRFLEGAQKIGGVRPYVLVRGREHDDADYI